METEQVKKLISERFARESIVMDSLSNMPETLKDDKKAEKWQAAGRPHIWIKSEKVIQCEEDTIEIYKDVAYGYMAALINDEFMLFGKSDITLSSRKTGNEYLVQGEYYGHKDFKVFKVISR